MWSVDRIAADIAEIGLPAGAVVLTHVSMRSIGQIEGGASGLIEAFQRALGSEATLVAPAFTPQFRDPAEWNEPPTDPEEIETIRNRPECFEAASSPVALPSMGIFAEVVRNHPKAWRSEHPWLSFSAIGSSAEKLMKGTPFHYPLGSESVPARIHDQNGYVILIGVGQDVNVSIHLAEVWGDVPYAHRSARIRTGMDHWTPMQGSPECRDGFLKMEPVLRQARLLQRGYIGNAPALLMRQRELISMGIAMVRGSAEALLCSSSTCVHCVRARQFTKPSLALPPDTGLSSMHGN